MCLRVERALWIQSSRCVRNNVSHQDKPQRGTIARPPVVFLGLANTEGSMKIRHHFKRLPLLALLGGATVADAQVQPQLAQRLFAEVKKLCERDAGGLWGVSLCGPMVIFDQATGTRATSQPEPEGPPPRFPGIADGAVSWGGLRWFAVPWYMFTGKTDEIGRAHV